jgi:hypothetical protein
VAEHPAKSEMPMPSLHMENSTDKGVLQDRVLEKMTKDDQGIWSVTVGPLGEQLWGYSFNVDGVKVLNPGVFGWIGVWSAGGQDTPEFISALEKVRAGGVNNYWIGTGTTDFALKGSETLHAAAKMAGLNVSYHTAPGAHYWFIWRQFLGEFGSILFR